MKIIKYKPINTTDYRELCRQTLLWAFTQEGTININGVPVQLQAFIKMSICIVQLITKCDDRDVYETKWRVAF
jgi:hypothetical protein